MRTVTKYHEKGKEDASIDQIKKIAHLSAVLRIKSPEEDRKMNRIEASRVLRDLMARVNAKRRSK